MEGVPKPNATVSFWEHFGLKSDNCGVSTNIRESIRDICMKEVAASQTSNSHLKCSHPIQLLTKNMRGYEGPSIAGQFVIIMFHSVAFLINDRLVEHLQP